jgi:hypothetical protein
VFDIDADVAAIGNHAEDQARAVRHIESKRRRRMRDLRAAVGPLTPVPRVGRDAQGASDQRARHDTPEQEHRAVVVVAESRGARARRVVDPRLGPSHAGGVVRERVRIAVRDQNVARSDA